MKEKLLYVICFGFMLGVLWRSFFVPDVRYAFPLLALLFLLILFLTIYRKKWLGILIFAGVLAFSFGAFWFGVQDTPPPETFEKEVGQNISFIGEITEKPSESAKSTQIIVITEEAGILLFADTGSPYAYGDKVKVTGKLARPDNFMTDQGKEFDYVNYLKNDDILYVMSRPKIEIISEGGGNFLKRMLFYARQKFDDALNRAIPDPESGLARGLILGERTSFAEDLRKAFVATGLIHIIAISGYNVTIVAEWIMKCLGFLPVMFGNVTGILGIILYVIMTGGAQTAIRAGIMASLALFARTIGRKYNVGRALLVTGVVMILISPRILAFDVSFQLSFLATIAVIYLVPHIEPYFAWLKWKWFRDIVVMTFSAYVFVLPLILYIMGNWSLIALPANIAVLPLIPLTMIASFTTGFAGLISGWLSWLPGKVSYVLLHYELSAIGFFSHLPFASVSVPDFPLVFTILMYVIFFYYLFSKRKMEKPERRLVLLLLAVGGTIVSASFFAYQHYASTETARATLETLLESPVTEKVIVPFVPDPRTKTSLCTAHDSLPDHACTPGAVFEKATVEQICVKGYTKTVRNVSTKLRKQIYAEYGVSYPQPRGAYEVDHLIPLAVGGSNDISNLFLESAEPGPGFHEKDVVEVFLQTEVCQGIVTLPIAQRQIANDWLAIYNAMTPEQIQAIKKKYSYDRTGNQ